MERGQCSLPRVTARSQRVHICPSPPPTHSRFSSAPHPLPLRAGSHLPFTHAQGDPPTHSSHLPFTPSLGDLPITAGSRLPFPPSRGSSQSLLLGGLSSHILSLGSPGRLVPLRRIQSSVSKAAFLGHTHHSPPSCPLPLRQQRPPGVPCPPPWLCLGAHHPLAWPFPLRAPAGSAGVPTARGRLSAVLGRPCAVR